MHSSKYMLALKDQWNEISIPEQRQMDISIVIRHKVIVCLTGSQGQLIRLCVCVYMCSCLCVFQGQSCGPGKLHPCSKWSCCCPEPPWEQPSCPERCTSRGKETMLMDPEPVSGILSWGGKTPCMEYQDKHFIPISFGVLYSIIGVNIDF